MEYTVLLGIIAEALAVMQLYFKRSIQAVVKVAADEMGEQKKGAVDYDYRFEYAERRGSNVTTSTSGKKITTMYKGGAVKHERPEQDPETTTQTGELFYGLGREKK